MMSRLLARNVGALAVAAALLTSSTVAFAAPIDDASIYLTEKKKATTLVGLDREVQQNAVKAARSRSNTPKLTTPGRAPQAGPSDKDLDEVCGDWFITWEEDADGNPILGTFTLYCGGSEIPLP